MRKLRFITGVILITAITSTLAYGGISSFGGRSSESREDRTSRSRALRNAEKAFIKGDYKEVLHIGEGYSGTTCDELQNFMGRALLKLKRFKEARNRFSRVINHSDSNRLLSEGYIGLADSYYLDGDHEKAKSHYEKFMGYIPDSDDMPIAYYRLSECYSKLGDKSESRKYYDNLIRMYPYSLEARLLVGEKSDFVTYSVQAGSFKKWKNAKKLRDELKDKGFDADVYTATVGDSYYYRVRVGRFSRLGEAEDMARTLRNKGYPVKIYP